MIGVPVGEPEAVLKVVQGDVERVLEERARAAGVGVWRGYRVCGVWQGPGGVRVSARGAGGVRVFGGEFVVGADGARSVVRELAGFASRTYPATVSAMAGDVRLGPVGALRPGWHRTERGWILARDVGGSVMRLRTLNCAGPHPARHTPLGVEELRREVSFIAGREFTMRAPRWLSRFSDFSRLAASYREGRVLLAGDAAHVHFPIGGQGLSAGLLDALDLGWKLAFTLAGTAGEDLLDSYGAERRPAAQRVIDNTRAQLALMRPDPGLEPLRELFGELMARGGAEGAVLASMVSAQDTVLPARGAWSSPWEGRFVPNVVLETARGRTEVTALLGAGRPLLLLFGERAARFAREARPWAGLVRVVRAAPVPVLDCEALLVRPDGYAGWASGGGELAGALRAFFGPAAPAGNPPARPAAGDTPDGNPAAGDTPDGSTPVRPAAGDTPDGNPAAGSTPDGSMPAGNTSAVGASAGSTSGVGAPAGGGSAGSTSAVGASVGEAEAGTAAAGASAGDPSAMVGGAGQASAMVGGDVSGTASAVLEPSPVRDADPSATVAGGAPVAASRVPDASAVADASAVVGEPGGQGCFPDPQAASAGGGGADGPVGGGL
ncbi:FAD-dependent monooxygenase [Streptomyces maremycinicus]|uniref:FAD-dependent monooxygenase n=1 Tax=Streptomyces maremycinicus TaxID=1679753 RepID=UPI0022770B4A|nr:FAD-dependent monooxygenase [Streptomyces sp. NBRC 110468]